MFSYGFDEQINPIMSQSVCFLPINSKEKKKKEKEKKRKRKNNPNEKRKNLLKKMFKKKGIFCGDVRRKQWQHFLKKNFEQFM